MMVVASLLFFVKACSVLRMTSKKERFHEINATLDFSHKYVFGCILGISKTFCFIGISTLVTGEKPSMNFRVGMFWFGQSRFPGGKGKRLAC